jgi:single-strand DNA-binding protein
MAISYNKVILVGRLTKDPDMSFASSGTQIAKFNLAVDRQYSKDKEQETDFLRVVSFGKAAEFVGNYMHKGMLIMVEGHIQTGRYENTDGITIYTTDIIAEKLNFMETKKQAQAKSDVVYNEPEEEIVNGDDETPF